jgi:hypothetical protein
LVAAAPVCVIPLLRGIAKVCQHLPLLLDLYLRAKALVRAGLAMATSWRRYLLGASRVETWLGVSVWWFFGARYWSELIFMGTMYATGDESKKMALSGQTKSRHPLAVSS